MVIEILSGTCGKTSSEDSSSKKYLLLNYPNSYLDYRSELRKSHQPWTPGKWQDHVWFEGRCRTTATVDVSSAGISNSIENGICQMDGESSYDSKDCPSGRG